MPPKNQPSKKNVDKQKAKIVEDKTFGLKNKKGAKQQKLVQQIQKSVFQGNKTTKELEKAKEQVENKKEQKKKELEEINALFKPVIEFQKVAKGVDPKSVLCAFYKNNQCTKGDKCKFSHDLNIMRRAEKRNIYEADEENDKEDMGNWDQSKLEDVVNRRHGTSNNTLPPTTIICKFFLDAVEGNKYGWFWSCPTGEKCHYKHALPADFVLKRDKKKMEEQKDDQISLEDLIEKERAALGDNLTKITWETFIQWKKNKREKQMQQNNAEMASREKAFRQGKHMGISGRELFAFNPDFVRESQDDDMEGGDVVAMTQRENNGGEDGEEEYNGPIREINISDYYGDMLALNRDNSMKKPEKVNEITMIDEELFQTEDLEGLDDEIDNLSISD